MGTGRACEALDGCSQPKGFDSPALFLAVQPNWNSGVVAMQAFLDLVLAPS